MNDENEPTYECDKCGYIWPVDSLDEGVCPECDFDGAEFYAAMELSEWRTA